MQHFSNINENIAGGTLAPINTDYIVLVERIVKTMFPFRYDILIKIIFIYQRN